MVWVLALLLGAVPLSAQSADFFVAPGGSDTGAGTLAAPFATLDRARLAVQQLKQASPGRLAPVTVMLRGGTYYLNAPLVFTAADSGTSTMGIVYQAYPGETPVISAGQPITGFTQTAPGTWTASLPPAGNISSSFSSTGIAGTGRALPKADIFITPAR